MDLKSIKTTDELFLILPPAENDKWELKGAQKLVDRDFEAELGKQVSAFANTGGGNLVFGISDKNRQVEPCIKTVGRQLMVDWLATKVQNSVAYSLQDFRIYEIANSDDLDQSIFVVEIGDSRAAPHQSKADSKYYWRLFGKSEAAPHFHLDLLRNRMVTTELEITSILAYPECTKWAFEADDALETIIRITIDITVRNISRSSASTWGVHFTTNEWLWINARTGKEIELVGCERGETENLLPNEYGLIKFVLTREVETAGTDMESHKEDIRQAMRELVFEFSPVSHNHIGKPVGWGNGVPDDNYEDSMDGVIDSLKSDGFDVWPASTS